MAVSRKAKNKKKRVVKKKATKAKPKILAKLKAKPKPKAGLKPKTRAKSKSPQKRVAISARSRKPKRVLLPISKVKVKKKKGLPPAAVVPVTPRRVGGEEEIEQKKFYVAPQPAPHAAGEDLPQRYGRNRIVLLARDPEWIFTYWEITPDRLGEAERFFGGEWGRTKTVLRVYDVTDIRFDGGNAHSFYDVEVTGNAVNWYLNVGKPDTVFIVDIARLSPSGRFFTLARSNAVRTPRNRMSDVIDEEWMSLDFDRLYALSGGLPRGASSAQVRRIVEKGLNLGLSSDSSPGLRKSRVAHG